MRQPVFNAAPAICMALMTAFVVGLSWLLHWLQGVLGFSGFMTFAIVTFAIMVACGYTVDYLQGRIGNRQP